VDVEQRHDVEAAIGRFELEGLGHVSGRDGEAVVRYGHELGPGRGPGRVQEERDVVRIGSTAIALCATLARLKDTRRVGRIDVELDDLDPALGGDRLRGRVDGRSDDERLGADVVEGERQLGFPVRRIQRRDRGGRATERKAVAASGPFSTTSATRLPGPRPWARSAPAVAETHQTLVLEGLATGREVRAGAAGS
jgi:hypothetical protein